MFISSFPQNCISPLSSSDSASLRFGVKRPHAKRKATTPVPKITDTTDFKTPKRKPKVTESKLWTKIERYKSLEGVEFSDPDRSAKHQEKLATYASEISDDVRLFLPKGTREQKAGVIENFWREVHANPWDILKKAGPGSLNLKKFQRQTSTFTYVSPPVSRSGSPVLSAFRKGETVQQEQNAALPSQSKPGSSTPVNTLEQTIEPVFLLQEPKYPGSNSSSQVSLFSPEFMENDFPKLTRPTFPNLFNSHSGFRESPFHDSLQGQPVDTFTDQFDITQGRVSALSSNKSFRISDYLEEGSTRSEKAAEVVKPLQGHSTSDMQVDARVELQKLTDIIRLATKEKEEKRNKAIRRLRPVFMRAVGVMSLDVSQEEILRSLIERIQRREKINIDEYINPARMDLDEIGSLSSEHTASVISTPERNQQQQRATSPYSQLSAERLQALPSDTSVTSKVRTSTWLSTLPQSTAASSLPPDDAFSVSEIPEASSKLPKVTSFKEKAPPVDVKSETYSDLLRELSEAPPTPKQVDDIYSVSSSLTSPSKLSVPSQNPFEETKKAAISSRQSNRTKSVSSDSDSAFESPSVRSSSGDSAFDAASSVKSTSVESDKALSEESYPRHKRRKVGVTHSTAKAVGTSAIFTNRESRLKQPQDQVHGLSRPLNSTLPPLSKDEMILKIQQLADKPTSDRREVPPKKVLKDYPIVTNIIWENVGKPLSYEAIYGKYKNLPVNFDEIRLAFLHFNKYIGYHHGQFLGKKYHNEALYQLVGPFCSEKTDVAKDVLFDQFKAEHSSRFSEEVMGSLSYGGFLGAIRSYENETKTKVGAGAIRAESKPAILRFIKEHGQGLRTPNEAFRLYKEMNPDGTASKPTFYRTLIWDKKLAKLRPRTEKENTYAR